MTFANFLTINGWQDLAAIVTILTFPFIAISIVAAFRQIKNQSALSASEISADVLVRFYENFTKTSGLRRALEARFDNGDKTINRYEVLQYYYQYWQQRELEWEYFVKGFISVDLLSRWSENAIKHMLNLRNMGYYDTEGVVEIKSRDIFENEVLNSIILRSHKCRQFYLDLSEVAKSIETNKIDLKSDRAFEEIKKCVQAHTKKLKIKTFQ